jgi:hypothetical protein
VEKPREFMVAFWYDIADPARTIQYQAYDERKHQYNKSAVKTWLDTVNLHFPLSRAALRSVSLADWPGETEALKLARAIEWHQNDLVAIARERPLSLPALVGPYITPSNRSRISPRRATSSSLGRAPGSGGMSGEQTPSIPLYLLNRRR